MSGPFADFLSDYLWVAILALASAFVIIGTLIYWCYVRRRLSAEYAPLLEELAPPPIPIKNESFDTYLYKTQQKSSADIKTNAVLNFQYYLRTNPQYRLLRHVGFNIGSRKDKYWFVIEQTVAGSAQKKEVLVSLVPAPPASLVPFSRHIRGLLKVNYYYYITTCMKQPNVLELLTVARLISRVKVLQLLHVNYSFFVRIFFRNYITHISSRLPILTFSAKTRNGWQQLSPC